MPGRPRQHDRRAPAVQRPRGPGRRGRRGIAGDRGRGLGLAAAPCTPRLASHAFLDTRYDAGHVLACQSRRLVDVCADLRLDVIQPELRGASMTALHRRWLERGDATAREKITVLNLRHSLSTAIVAARAAGLAHWQPGLNVNRLLAGRTGQRNRLDSRSRFHRAAGRARCCVTAS